MPVANSRWRCVSPRQEGRYPGPSSACTRCIRRTSSCQLPACERHRLEVARAISIGLFHFFEQLIGPTRPIFPFQLKPFHVLAHDTRVPQSHEVFEGLEFGILRPVQTSGLNHQIIADQVLDTLQWQAIDREKKTSAGWLIYSVFDNGEDDGGDFSHTKGVGLRAGRRQGRAQLNHLFRVSRHPET